MDATRRYDWETFSLPKWAMSAERVVDFINRLASRCVHVTNTGLRSKIIWRAKCADMAFIQHRAPRAYTLMARGVPHRVMVVGEGPARDSFAQHVPTAVFAGFQEGASLGRAVASMDVLFNPSVTAPRGGI